MLLGACNSVYMKPGTLDTTKIIYAGRGGYGMKRSIKEVMETRIEELDGKFVATLDGEMDTAAAVEAEEILKPLYNSEGKDVVIDCEKLEYIASSGLRILISILKGAKAGGSRVVLKKVNDDIMNVFRLTGFIDLFEFEG